MLRNKLGLAVLAALMVAPAASSASVLSRRLTIRYPGQDAKKRHHVHWESRRHDRRDHRREDRRDGRWDRRPWEDRRDL